MSKTLDGNPTAATLTGAEKIALIQNNADVTATVNDLLAGGTVPDANITTKGKLKLANHLGGTADNPTVPGLATKADDSAVVKLTGTQTIGGIKTFTNGIVVPANSLEQSDIVGLGADLLLKANTTDVVKLFGAETIAGVKTFSSAPVVPDSSFAVAKVTGLQTALDGKVNDTGAETIAGVKTFSSSPVVPDGSFSTAKTIGLQAALDALIPWTVDIDAFQSITHTNWNTLTPGTHLYGGYNMTSGAQNDEIGWDVVLSAGTWTIQLTHYTINSSGIYSIRIDGVEVGTIDGYSAGGGPNQNATITGVTVATSGKKRVLLKMATKHASSSAYYGLLQHLQLRRTA